LAAPHGRVCSLCDARGVIEDAAALGKLCEALPLLRQLATTPELTAEIDGLVDAGRSGERIGSGLVGLGRRLGVPLGVVSTRSGDVSSVTLPGLSGGYPAPQVFGCPGGECARRWVRRPGVSTPVCAIHETRLREVSP
jgi:hypothetical protein